MYPMTGVIRDRATSTFGCAMGHLTARLGATREALMSIKIDGTINRRSAREPDEE